MKKTNVFISVIMVFVIILTGCSGETQPEQTEKEETVIKLEADIAIVGSGLSGMAAALEASQQGSSVILIEKQGYIGGGIVASPGNLLISQVDENKEAHQYDSNEKLGEALDRWKEVNEEEFDSGYPDYERISELLIQSSKTIQWLVDIGAKFIPNLTIEKNSFDTVKVDVPTTESTMGGAKLVQEMQNKAEANGAKFFTNMTATSLKIDNDEVTGVIAESNNETYEISAKNVILACGGFGGNDEMMAKYVEPLDATNYYYQGLKSNTGDGITMAELAGADIYSDGWVAASNITPSEELIDTNKQFAKLVQGFVYTVKAEGDEIEGASSYYHLLVDKDGKRVGNEAEGAKNQIRTLADLASAPYYVLYDNPKGELQEILESGLQIEEVFKAENLTELSKIAKMDSSTLVETVEKYSKAAIDGIDNEYGKPTEYLKEISDEGPYYLVHFVPSYVATYGGVKTNENYQALKADGSQIENLYAVGENAIRFAYNRSYVSGSSNNFSLSMGRMAAIHAISK